MKKIYYFSLFLTIGLSIFASGGGGADKYGNTHSSAGGGGGGGADETVSAISATAEAPDPRSHSHRGASVAQNQVFGNQYLAENIAQYFSPQEATQGLGLINKTSHSAAKWRSRCAHAAAIAQPIVLRGHGRRVTSVAVSPDGRIVSGSDDGTVRVWNPDIAADQPGYMVVLQGHEDAVPSIAVLPDGRIVSGSWDGTVRVWNLNIPVGENGHMLVLGGHDDFVLSVAVSPDGRIVSVSDDGTVRVWNPDIFVGENGHMVVLQGYGRYVTSVAVSPDGRIVSGSGNGTVRVWNPDIAADQSEHMLVLRFNQLRVNSVAVLRDGRIVSGLDDCTVRVWNPHISAGQPGHMIVLRGHDELVNSVAVMQDGRIVSGSLDCTVRVWNPDVAPGQPGHMVVIGEHEDWVVSVAVSPDGQIVSGSYDGTVRVWPTEEYFRAKVKRTQDPRDYEMDGSGVYEALFGAETPVSAAEAAAALDQKDHQGGGGADADVAIEQPTVEEAVVVDDRADADDVQPAAEMSGDFITEFNSLTEPSHIIEALSGWLSDNFTLDGEALQLLDDSNIDLLSVQAMQVIKRLQSRNVPSDIMRQQVKVFGKKISVSALIRKLQPVAARVRDHQGGGGADADVQPAMVAVDDRANAVPADREESDDDSFGDIDLDGLDFADTAGLASDDRGWGNQR